MVLVSKGHLPDLVRLFLEIKNENYKKNFYIRIQKENILYLP